MSGLDPFMREKLPVLWDAGIRTFWSCSGLARDHEGRTRTPQLVMPLWQFERKIPQLIRSFDVHKDTQRTVVINLCATGCLPRDRRPSTKDTWEDASITQAKYSTRYPAVELLINLKRLKPGNSDESIEAMWQRIFASLLDLDT